MRNITMSEYKQSLIEMLIEVDNFCKENKIKYFLMGGTLLGAIRHKGFIPWDDDIDIAFLRSDYDIFIKSFKSSKPYHKILYMENDKNYYYPFAKIIDERIELIEDVPNPVTIGAYLDVFPIDNCPGKTYDDACKTYDKMHFLRWTWNFKNICLNKNRNFFKNVALFCGKVITSFLTRRQISKKFAKKAKKFSKKKSNYVAVLFGGTYGHGEVLSRKIFDATLDVEFEGRNYKAPVGYDELLKSFYGNYMELPPVDKRISTHNFKCWYKE